MASKKKSKPKKERRKPMTGKKENHKIEGVLNFNKKNPGTTSFVMHDPFDREKMPHGKIAGDKVNFYNHAMPEDFDPEKYKATYCFTFKKK